MNSLLSSTRASTRQEGQENPFHLGYRPALDGLRGVAILAVIATHAKFASGWFGDFGVDTFFVLSGFLITSLLIEEWDRFHAISLRRFYARRALRLLPALLLMIAVFVTWHWVMSPRAVSARTAIDGLIALFYSTNWMFALGLRQPAHVFAHTWTLSIEEQFYLTWPIMLILLLRRTVSRASLARWVLLAMFILMVERVILIAAIPTGVYAWLNYGTDARADVLFTGCVAGIAFHSNSIFQHKRCKRAIKYLAWLVGIPGFLLISHVAHLSVDFDAIALDIAIAVFAVLILVEAVVSQEGVLGQVLSQRWLVYVGKISYGLYLWHYPIFSEVQGRHWRIGYEILVEVTLTILATATSFYFIERPALKLKSRFSPRADRQEETRKQI